MSSPVLNWSKQVLDTPVYFDSADPALRHYGPRVAWRELDRSDIGRKKAVFSGRLEFGYEAAELRLLQDEMPDKLLRPIISRNIDGGFELAIDIAPPHTASLTWIHSLPFPALIFSSTVDLQHSDGLDLAARIEKMWTDGSLMTGEARLEFEAVIAEGGYAATIDYGEFARTVLDGLAQNSFSAVEAHEATSSCVSNASDRWLSYFGAAEAGHERELAELALAEMLHAGAFQRAAPDLVRYDNGIHATRWSVRDPSSFRRVERRTLVATTPKAGTFVLTPAAPDGLRPAAAWSLRLKQMEFQPAPAPTPGPGDLRPARPEDYKRLTAETAEATKSIAGAAMLFHSSCAGGDNQTYKNNCAHFLSDAFFRAGYEELASPNTCITARCGTEAARPIRARDMWCWFQKMATRRQIGMPKNEGFWAVFQLDEQQYWGGHVLIVDTNTGTYFGTGCYPDWDQYAYQW